MHENQLHGESCFITLTYDPENLPPGGSLVVKDFQDFMKRLRKFVKRPVRFFHCGEYGENLERPHYHALIFGYSFPDKTPHKKTSGGQLYRSTDLERLWPQGFSTIGPVTFETAAYVARYCVKKINGKGAAEHYGVKLPEYVTMSRRPGIAAGWVDKYSSDVYPSDQVITRGHPAKPPRAYDRHLEKSQPHAHKALKRERLLASLEPVRQVDSTSARLAVRETVQTARANLYKRNLSQ